MRRDYMDGQALDQLVIQAVDGDNQAYDNIVRELGGELHIFVSCRCANAEVVEEIVQKAFVIGWERLDTYEQRGFLAAWLKGIARNLLHEEHRSRQRQQPVAIDSLEQFIDERLHEQAAQQNLADNNFNQLPRLTACMEKLPQRSRDLLDKHHHQNIPLKTLAQHYKKKVSSLSALLHRLRSKLRACVEAQS